jgi:hypothetical protein
MSITSSVPKNKSIKAPDPTNGDEIPLSAVSTPKSDSD